MSSAEKPRWSDLFGIDPDYTEDPETAKRLDRDALTQMLRQFEFPRGTSTHILGFSDAEADALADAILALANRKGY